MTDIGKVDLMKVVIWIMVIVPDLIILYGQSVWRSWTAARDLYAHSLYLVRCSL